jgi:DNA polymerase III subunit epsilon
VLLEDTGHLQSRRRRDALLRGLTESTRSAAAGIRAAVETLLDYPDMDAGERAQFLDIAREESTRLGEQVDQWAAETAGLGSEWLLTDMAGEDLLAVLRRELERDGVPTSAGSPAAPTWLRVDTHALARALCHLVGRLREHGTAQRLELSLAPSGRHAVLDVRWSGGSADPVAFKAWLDEPLAGGAADSVREVVERHDAEVWAATAADDGAHLRLLLPVNEAAPRPEAATPIAFGSRPEFYDFDLFDLPEESLAWHDRRLAELAFTVFDTETTGFAPDEGDEIVAVGAVHVVGGRLRRHETFERLVDPRRRVPKAATAVHGITTEMVQGQPPLEQVLPTFARFAEDMVLVGHNVGFDMSFLRAREARTGVRFTQPVLDTLLLDAVLFPDHESHSLEAVAARLGVDVIGRHTALGDALVTGEVFVRLLALLQQRGTGTLGEALAASRATYQARLDATLYGG